jgi:hypothetical protein
VGKRSEGVSVDGADLPARPRTVCRTAGDASLERLLMITDDEAKARGCRAIARPGEGWTVIKMSGPASGNHPAVEATADGRLGDC